MAVSFWLILLSIALCAVPLTYYYELFSSDGFHNSFFFGSRSAVNRSKLLTRNFVIEIEVPSEAAANPNGMFLFCHRQAPASDQASIKIYHNSDVSHVIWKSDAMIPFIRSAVGSDSLSPGNGEYRIIQKSLYVTTQQTVSNLGYLMTGRVAANIDLPTEVMLTGQLLYPIDKKGTMLPMVNYTFTITERSPEMVDFEIDLVEVHNMEKYRGYDRVIFTSGREANEDIFGMGEQFSFFNLNGQRVPVMSREQGIARGRQPVTYFINHVPPKNPSYAGADTLATYSAIGHYITSSSNSFFLNNTELAFFDFSMESIISVEVASLRFRASSFYSDRPLDLIRAYTSEVSGRMDKIPKWATGRDGAIVGIQGGQDKVVSVIEALQKWNVKIAAVWLQDWVGTRQQPMSATLPIPFLIPGFPQRSGASITMGLTSPQKRLWWNWVNDRSTYPDWATFADSIKRKYGVRTMAYVNPFFSDIELGGKPKGSYSRNLFAEASDLGYLVKRWIRNETDQQWSLNDYLIESGPGLVAGMIDLFNPDARTWFKAIIKSSLLDNGISGWMADFAEYLPYDAVVYENRFEKPPTAGETSNPTARRLHNLYPLEWSKLNKQVAQESGRDDIVIFSRSITPQSPANAISFWVGDQLHTWDHLDGLESTIHAQLSASLSGLAYMHSDIGGYTTVNVNPKVKIIIADRETTINIPILENNARLIREDQELMERWMEVSALSSTALFRTHEGSAPDENIQVWDNENLARKFGHFYQMFESLQPYRALLEDEHTDFGYSPMRPLFLHFPGAGKAAWSIERLQYMLGPALIVIPISSPGVTRINQVITDLPLDEPPEDDTKQVLIDTITELERGKRGDYIKEGQVKFSVSPESDTIWFQQQPLVGLLQAMFEDRPTGDNDTFDSIRIGDDGPIVAPKVLPKPLHGRPYLPQGKWMHIMTETTFVVSNPEGLYLSDTLEKANIACRPGEPAVFLRVLTRVDMNNMISTGIEGTSMAEDWKYWIDGIAAKHRYDEAKAAEFAWKKYQAFRQSLDPFISFLETKKYPRF